MVIDNPFPARSRYSGKPFNLLELLLSVQSRIRRVDRRRSTTTTLERTYRTYFTFCTPWTYGYSLPYLCVHRVANIWKSYQCWLLAWCILATGRKLWIGTRNVRELFERLSFRLESRGGLGGGLGRVWGLRILTGPLRLRYPPPKKERVGKKKKEREEKRSSGKSKPCRRSQLTSLYWLERASSIWPIVSWNDQS